MIAHKFCVLALLAIANGLPTRWRSATVKLDIADLDEEYDYIVGKCT